MSQTKDQVPLNGAYYGPSVPPQQAYHQRRKRGCLSCFLVAIATIAVALGIAALIAWLVIRPREVKFYVVTAELNQMDLTNRNTLNYSLSLDMAVRNPNRRIGIYYDQIDATASYKGERFGWTSIPRFYQGHKNTTDLRASFQGQQVIVLSGNEVDQFNQDRNNGFFRIHVKLDLRIRMKVGAIKTRRINPDVECDLRIPLPSNASASRRFERMRCDFDF